MIELLIVMTLIIILASVGMTQYRNSVTRAEEAVLKENLFRMRDAMDQFYADKNKWPADLAELVSEGYIREIPDDPITKSKDTWQTVTGGADPNNPASAGGIDNVHSGSDRTGARRHAATRSGTKRGSTEFDGRFYDRSTYVERARCLRTLALACSEQCRLQQ